MKLCTVIVTVGLLLAGCSYTGMGLPHREAAPPIPAYPKVQNVTRQPISDAAEETTFDTTDSPDVVYQFYDKQLPKQGRNSWRLYDGGRHQYIARGCPYTFFVTLTAVPAGQGMTHVAVYSHRSDWCY